MKNINFNISSIREFFLNRLPEFISNLDQRVVIAAGATFGLLVTALGIGLTIKLLGNRVKRKAPDSSKSSESETKKSKPNNTDSKKKPEHTKTDSKKKDDTSKTDPKKKLDTSKTDSKKKDDTSKTDSKKKDDTSKTDPKKKPEVENNSKNSQQDQPELENNSKNSQQDQPELENNSKNSQHEESEVENNSKNSQHDQPEVESKPKNSQHEESEVENNSKNSQHEESEVENNSKNSQHEESEVENNSKNSQQDQPELENNSKNSQQDQPELENNSKSITQKEPEEESAFLRMMKEEEKKSPSEETKLMGTATYTRELGKKIQESLVTADSEENENVKSPKTSDTKPAIKKSASQEFDDILNNPSDKQQDPKRFDDLFATTSTDSNSNPWSTFGTGTTPFGGSLATNQGATTFNDMFGSIIGGNNTSSVDTKPAPEAKDIFGDDEDLLNFFNTDQTQEETEDKPKAEEID